MNYHFFLESMISILMFSTAWFSLLLLRSSNVLLIPRDDFENLICTEILKCLSIINLSYPSWSRKCSRCIQCVFQWIKCYRPLCYFSVFRCLHLYLFQRKCIYLNNPIPDTQKSVVFLWSIQICFQRKCQH